MNKTFLACERSEGSAKRRDQRHTLWCLKRCHFFSAQAATVEEKRGSAEGRVHAPLPGLGQRPVSKAHAVELELELELEHKSLPLDSKSKN